VVRWDISTVPKGDGFVTDKNELEQLAEKLGLERKNVWNEISPEDQEKIMALGEDYKAFLDKSKTERAAAAELAARAHSAGFKPLDSLLAGGSLQAGARFYKVFKEKVVIMGVVGRQRLEAGLKIVGSHIDAPRLDLKPNPLYEKKGLALLKTHYYGGIKKYQWTAMPLALYGVVILESGEKIQVCLGEQGDEPVFTVTDLLPHLSKEQGKRKLAEGIKGEELNVLVGSIPLKGEHKKKVKLAVLKHLNDTYGMVEEDFSSADFEVVPAGPARDVGFDRAMVGAYGQDDRVCAYASYKAIEQLQIPEKTALALFMDKEEVGSMGNTGMQSRVLEDVLFDLSTVLGCSAPASKVFYASEALSADVSPALDPTWDSVMDDLNSARLGGGVCITKYTGSRGKSGASEAHAEFTAKVRRIFNQNKVIWQIGQLGKVDAGGGGTIAQFLANLNMDVIDCGVPVLSMHSPFEITSKADVFMGCRAYKAFWESI